MKSTKIVTSFVVSVALSGVTFASAGTPVDGLRPLGGAQIVPVGDQCVDVAKLGSSGEDGVEVSMSSAFGAGATVDLTGLLNTSGATCSMVQNGREGLSYGTSHIVSRGDGTGTIVFDHSEIGATGIRVVEYDEAGAVVSDETFHGPMVNGPIVKANKCPPGMQWRFMSGWVGGSWWTGWGCGPLLVYTYDRVVVVTPILPDSASELAGVRSMSITASGIPELILSEATIASCGK